MWHETILGDAASCLCLAQKRIHPRVCPYEIYKYKYHRSEKKTKTTTFAIYMFVREKKTRGSL